MAGLCNVNVLYYGQIVTGIVSSSHITGHGYAMFHYVTLPEMVLHSVHVLQ